MKKIIILLIVCCLKGNAQVNLVKNPSFEDLYSNPSDCYNGQIYLAKHWNQYDSLCAKNSISSCPPAINSKSCTSLCCHIPNEGQAGYQYPRTGNNIAAAYAFTTDTTGSNPEYRNYLHGLLTQTLQVSKQYCITYYINLYNPPHVYAVNHFGMYLDNGKLDTLSACAGIFTVTAQIDNTTYPLLNDTLNWMKIQGVYTANGTETHITIGNFATDGHSNVTKVYNGNLYTDAFYNIDDISLIPIDLAPYAGNDTTIAHGDSAYIGRPSEVGLDDDCIWYLLGNTTAIDTVAGMWIKPTTTTSYVVEQNICGTITYDTVKVTVNPLGISEISLNTQINIYPNPATKSITLTHPKVEGTYYITLHDMLGNILMQHPSEGQGEAIDVSGLNEGIYNLSIATKAGVVNKRVVVVK